MQTALLRLIRSHFFTARVLRMFKLEGKHTYSSASISGLDILGCEVWVTCQARALSMKDKLLIYCFHYVHQQR